MTKKIVVVGAGITGLLCAYYLVKAGHKVTIYEQERYPAMRTSFANGGQVSVSNSEVWTTWSNVRKGLKWIFKKDAPLLIRPRFDIKQWRWLAKFLYYTATGHYEKNTKETIRLGLESNNLYKEIIKNEMLEFDQSLSGILHFYKDPVYFENAIKSQDIYQSNGVGWDIFGPAQIKSLDKTLSNINNIIGGAWTWHDWTGDIHKFCYNLSDVLEEKYGVEFRFNDKISSSYDLEILEDCFDSIVISAGVGSEKLANIVGERLDVYPVKGYSITINVDDASVLPKVSLLDEQAKIVTSTLGNRFRVAGTAEITGENYDIRQDRIKPLLDWVHKNFPDINTHNYTTWACLRPMTPNMMPIVRQSKINPKVYYHTGHGHLGWTLSPATALQLTELIK